MRNRHKQPPISQKPDVWIRIMKIATWGLGITVVVSLMLAVWTRLFGLADVNIPYLALGIIAISSALTGLALLAGVLQIFAEKWRHLQFWIAHRQISPPSIPENYIIGDDGEILEIKLQHKHSPKPHQR